LTCNKVLVAAINTAGRTPPRAWPTSTSST
jgi:hypothetical protein